MNEEAAPNVRYAEIRYGDDLRQIALRELGDAASWLDLVILNDLAPPYISRTGGDRVLAYGDQIAIPSDASTISAETDPVAVFGADVALLNRRLVVINGDLAVAAGLANLRQALILRLMVNKRELAFHPEFGCYVRSLLGRKTTPTTAQLAAFYVKSALLEDSRVESVASCVATVAGDEIKVEATIIPISGKPIDLGVLL